MDKLALLQQKKALTAARIAQQKRALKETLLEVKAAAEPANLLKKAITGAIETQSNTPGGSFGKGVFFLIDLLTKDPKWSILLKLLTPVALRFLPARNKLPELPTEAPTGSDNERKPNIYGRLRQGVANLRIKLKKKEKESPVNPELPEN